MKKILTLAVASILFLVLSTAGASTQLSLIYISRNNTGSIVATTVSTSTIIPGTHRIVGYQVVPSEDATHNTGAWATIYCSNSGTQADIIGETEIESNTSGGEVWGYPKALKAGGLTIHQSEYSTVLVEYTR